MWLFTIQFALWNQTRNIISTAVINFKNCGGVDNDRNRSMLHYLVIQYLNLQSISIYYLLHTYRAQCITILDKITDTDENVSYIQRLYLSAVPTLLGSKKKSSYQTSNCMQGYLKTKWDISKCTRKLKMILHIYIHAMNNDNN